ncbi:DUF7144 family membrane protein [Actinomadura rupiterrae]|uniref:DUF7144 family membrane protein n=1 Tax=Actinomadura rupiterrae TaxID=559627 RepID=UPI0020A3AFBE|nr:hypothetical protein [Actinomadura rupiterrae]MCP2342256.1 hypothetical protein [Actinomadura rupiterrae]
MMTTAPVRHSTHSGWLAFAGMLAVLLGIFNAVDGIVALFKKEYFVTPDGNLLVFSYTAWGWIWLIVGIVQIAVGVGILTGKAWARWAGVFLAGLAMIGQFAFLGAYPIWSIINMVLAVLVIYGLVAAPRDATG